ncbi:MAG: squalene synthase HpnC [Alphaproteobacteria bacterium]|nr:squalene synthase HpnC [Alphaproteobacteria bacterium]
MTAIDSVETPSGKGAGDENFPVGSWLLPAKLRPHVAVFYAYARAIDDIADNPALAPEDKISRLEGFSRAISGAEIQDPAYEKAHRMRASLGRTHIPTTHCTDLIAAFKQDATKLRYRDWQELMQYCDRSASPVGRYLLDLHGESKSGYVESDALCNALQVLNHLQDCKVDYLQLNRVYLPETWLEEAGSSVEDLAAPAASPGLRRVIDRCLDGVEELLVSARRLPAVLGSRFLAMETAVIVAIAERLAQQLRHRDPLAERVVLSKAAYLSCFLKGVARVLL